MADDPNSTTPGLPTFDYNLESDKVLRRRQIANMLAQQSQTQGEGKVFSNPMFTGYIPGQNGTPIGAVARVLSAYLSNRQQNQADAAQSALTQQADQRFSDRNSQLAGLASQVLGGGSTPPSAPPAGSSGAQSFPMPDSGAQTSAPMPLPPQAAAQVLASTPGPTPSVSAAPDQATPTADQLAQIAQTDPEGAANLQATTGTAPQAPPIDPQLAAQVLSQQAAPPAPAPAPATQGPPPPNNGVPPEANIPSPPVPTSAAPTAAAVLGTQTPAPAPQGPTPQQIQLQRQSIISQMMHEGPAAQAQAQAMMQAQYSPGEFKTLKDENGAEHLIYANPRTGQASEVGRVGAATSPVTGQTTLQDGTLVNMHKDGTTSPVIAPGGGAAVSQSHNADVRADKENTINTGKALTANQSALASVNATLARLDRIQQLYTTTATGPIAGHLPDWTSNRQELHSLLAQDIFAETRDAVSGAADAGGAPRMAQSEFKYMANNGGLSQTTNAPAAINLINQQKLRLTALKQSLGDYGATLQSVAPPQQGGAAPARGQTVTAADYGFK
jgi:hypothetical protein